MKKFFDLPTLFLLSLVFWASMAIAKDFVIYSIAQDFPMGNKGEVLRKNFYVNIGKNQGINKGSVLDVYRIVSVLDPYESKKRYNHKVKIGEIKILQAEDLSAVGTLNKMEKDEETPVLDVSTMMIGDTVNAHVN